MHRINISIICFILVLSCLGNSGCKSRKDNSFGPKINIYLASNGEPIARNLSLEGVINDKSGGLILVFDQASKKSLEDVTSSRINHGQLIYLLAGNFRIGSVKNVVGFASGFIYVDEANESAFRLFRKAGISVVQSNDTPFTYLDALRILE